MYDKIINNKKLCYKEWPKKNILLYSIFIIFITSVHMWNHIPICMVPYSYGIWYMVYDGVRYFYVPYNSF